MINTLSIARKLWDSGVKREQAEAIADVVADAVNQQYENLATKDFVRNQISIVRSEISDLRADMNAKISTLETWLVRWIVATGLVVAGLLITVITVFLGVLRVRFNIYDPVSGILWYHHFFG